MLVYLLIACNVIMWALYAAFTAWWVRWVVRAWMLRARGAFEELSRERHARVHAEALYRKERREAAFWRSRARSQRKLIESSLRLMATGELRWLSDHYDAQE